VEIKFQINPKKLFPVTELLHPGSQSQTTPGPEA